MVGGSNPPGRVLFRRMLRICGRRCRSAKTLRDCCRSPTAPEQQPARSAPAHDRASAGCVPRLGRFDDIVARSSATPRPTRSHSPPRPHRRGPARRYMSVVQGAISSPSNGQSRSRTRVRPCPEQPHRDDRETWAEGEKDRKKQHIRDRDPGTASTSAHRPVRIIRARRPCGTETKRSTRRKIQSYGLFRWSPGYDGERRSAPRPARRRGIVATLNRRGGRTHEAPTRRAGLELVPDQRRGSPQKPTSCSRSLPPDQALAIAAELVEAAATEPRRSAPPRLEHRLADDPAREVRRDTRSRPGWSTSTARSLAQAAAGRTLGRIVYLSRGRRRRAARTQRRPGSTSAS